MTDTHHLEEAADVLADAFALSDGELRRLMLNVTLSAPDRKHGVSEQDLIFVSEWARTVRMQGAMLRLALDGKVGLRIAHVDDQPDDVLYVINAEPYDFDHEGLEITKPECGA